jgi:hypothetical protein
MDWAGAAARKRGDTSAEKPDFSGYEVPEELRGLGSWRPFTFRWAKTCQWCGEGVHTGLQNRMTTAAMCDRSCLDAWRATR